MPLTSASPVSITAARALSLALGQGGDPVDPTGDPFITSVVDNGDGTLTIQGGNFGIKAQAAPVLYDHTDSVWENGVENTRQALFTDGQAIERVASDPETLWHKSTEGAGAVKVTRSRPKRHPMGTAHYYGEGADTYLGWPKAFGGESPNLTSSDFYFSAWLRYPYNMSYFYAIPADSKPTSFSFGAPFEYGEDITVSGAAGTGKVIDYLPDLSGVVTEGWLFIEPPPGVSVNDLKGATITGVESGATLQFPDSASVDQFDSRGYIPPRGKYARFWNDSSATGHVYAWGNSGIAGTGSTLWAEQAQDGRGRVAHKPDDWSRFEFKFRKNATEVFLETWIDGVLHSISTPEWIDSVRAEIAGDLDILSIALLGVNDFATAPWRFEAADIYADIDFRRVVLSDSPTYQNANIVELQRPYLWSDNQIKVAKFEGALTGQKYLFMFDADDNLINAEGIAL